MSDARKVGVVLFQLGGPDSLEAVEPFLYNLFRDPDIIDFPFARLAREPLARLVARHRAKKVRRHYEEIGGRSPIGELTQSQANALERELRKTLDTRVFVAMRYWHPLTEEVVERIRQEGISELVLLPLYPQYSRVTTGSSLNEWRRQCQRLGLNHLPTNLVRDFHRHPLYLEAVREQIDLALARFAQGAPVALVFSAHGVPRNVIESGDPYQEQVEGTVEGVIHLGAWGHPHRVCYQSRVGPGRWLEPSLHQTLHDLSALGVENVVVAPVSFVTDHVETLHEIDRDARAEAKALGIRQFELMPALNDSPRFIQALAELVLKAVGAGIAEAQSVS